MELPKIKPWSDYQYAKLGLVKLAARVDACLTAAEILSREAGIAVAETARAITAFRVKLPLYERGLDRLVKRLNAMTGHKRSRSTIHRYCQIAEALAGGLIEEREVQGLKPTLHMIGVRKWQLAAQETDAEVAVAEALKKSLKEAQKVAAGMPQGQTALETVAALVRQIEEEEGLTGDEAVEEAHARLQEAQEAHAKQMEDNKVAAAREGFIRAAAVFAKVGGSFEDGLAILSDVFNVVVGTTAEVNGKGDVKGGKSGA